MLTTTLGAYVADGVSEEAVEAARPSIRVALLDTAACIVAGRRHGATRLAAEWASQGMPSGDSASLLLTRSRGSARGAAFVNAVSAHAWEFDDAGLASHPSAVLIPTILAEAERLEVAGDDLVAAYVAAYQVWADLNRRRSHGLHALGWHPTAVYGVVGAAAATAAIRRLDAETSATALGIAASFASGVVANFGTATKPLQVGFAAERGLLAADLAELGVTSAPGALDGPGGLLPALDQSESTPVRREFATDPLDILVAPPTVKKYPICLASHRVIDGLLDMVTGGDVSHDDITSVEAEISEASAAVLRRGQNGPGGIAQFSLEFAVATAALHGRIGLAEVQPRLVDDRTIRDLMAGVEIRTTTTKSPDEPSFALADRVVVTTRHGERYDSGEIKSVRGSAKTPLGPGELQRKVSSCLEFGEDDDAEHARILDWIEGVIA